MFISIPLIESRVWLSTRWLYILPILATFFWILYLSFSSARSASGATANSATKLSESHSEPYASEPFLGALHDSPVEQINALAARLSEVDIRVAKLETNPLVESREILLTPSLPVADVAEDTEPSSLASVVNLSKPEREAENPQVQQPPEASASEFSESSLFSQVSDQLPQSGFETELQANNARALKVSDTAPKLAFGQCSKKDSRFATRATNNEYIAIGECSNEWIVRGFSERREDFEIEAGRGITSSSATKGPATVTWAPSGAVLTEAIMVTALIGRVPSQGQIVDPIAFKAVVKNANFGLPGERIRGFRNAVVQGEAVGDFLLSCVRGRITNITWSNGRGGWHELSDSAAGIGYISDQYGNPCLKGKLVTSLYLGAGISAALSALNEVNAAREEFDRNLVQSQIGIPSADYFIEQGAVKGSTQAINEWVGDRLRESFDAIVVPPGEPVAIHLLQALNTP